MLTDSVIVFNTHTSYCCDSAGEALIYCGKVKSGRNIISNGSKQIKTEF